MNVLVYKEVNNALVRFNHDLNKLIAQYVGEREDIIAELQSRVQRFVHLDFLPLPQKLRHFDVPDICNRWEWIYARRTIDESVEDQKESRPRKKFKLIW